MDLPNDLGLFIIVIALVVLILASFTASYIILAQPETPSLTVKMTKLGSTLGKLPALFTKKRV